ncbi:MAG: glutathione S-transferase family protein, partial [Myxococcota bacterium]
THPEKPLLPSDPKQAARALFLEEYADTKFNEAVGGIFFERFVKPNVFQQETDEAKVQEVVESQLPEPLDYLESQVPADGWLAGDFSVADAAVGNQLGSLQFARVELDAKRWPKLAAYRERLFARPSFKKALAFG